MCVFQWVGRERAMKLSVPVPGKWLFCQESEFSDLNVEGEMGYMLSVRLYVLRIWQEQYSGILVTRAHGTQRAV